MSFNPLATEIQIYGQPTKLGHGVTINKDGSSGRVQAVITNKSSKGNYGFNLDLSFDALFTEDTTEDCNIIFNNITVNDASTWFDCTSRIETVVYELGCDDLALITPAIRTFLIKKITENNIATCLPASTFELKTESEIEKVVEHLVIDFETDAFAINLEDSMADGGVTILVDGNISFLTEFKATYQKHYAPAEFSNGKLITPKKDELINIHITDLHYADFENIAQEEYDFEYHVLPSDVLLIKKLILEQIKVKHEEEAYPMGRKHPNIS